MPKVWRGLKAIILSFVLVGGLFLTFQLLFFYKASNQSAWLFCTEVWAHRGLTKDAADNTLGAFSAALKAGAKGLEVDVFYDIKTDQFHVRHDPKPSLDEGKELTLAQVFSAFGSSTQYWLDFKNLVDLDNQSRQSALQHLIEISENVIERKYILVESVNDHALRTFTENGFNTSYWVALGSELSHWHYALYATKIKIKYLLGWFTTVSTDVDNYSDRFQYHFPEIPTLLFTVNEPQKIAELVQPNIKVVLTDSAIYSQFASCHQNGGKQ
ncbi:hypothetical protein CW749_10545 [Vibrio sp. vnigr-6D03]|uniref:glycerophosphodiester phosphodiesterase family protein n=1 Tax=Vibrio sp. vnigr-6D03 TaxID=2058088 RepID=UPI000C34B3AF|nr:glycerophosphodiester phosphodiesterase family protein [Vibrio sp. vnigr-6D03]PKF80114.1 hypothetical protein CW749_10545 [Vibrio sp. vnigr-6D03]